MFRFFLILLLFPTLAFAIKLEQVNDNLFISKRGKGQTFVMKAMESRDEFRAWMEFGIEEDKRAQNLSTCALKEQGALLAQDYPESHPWVKDLDRVMAIKDAPAIFSSPLGSEMDIDMAGLGEESPNSRFWVSFLYNHKERFKPDDVRITSLEAPVFNGIEILVSIMTNKVGLFSHHFGIWRTIRYSEQCAKGKAKRHANLAMELHRFSAAVTRQHAPQVELMITSPTDSMRALMARAMPHGSLHTEISSNYEFICLSNILSDYHGGHALDYPDIQAYEDEARRKMIFVAKAIEGGEPVVRHKKNQAEHSHFAIVYTSPVDRAQHVLSWDDLTRDYYAFSHYDQLVYPLFELVAIDHKALADLKIKKKGPQPVRALKRFILRKHSDPVIRTGMLDKLWEAESKAQKRAASKLNEEAEVDEMYKRLEDPSLSYTERLEIESKLWRLNV